MHDITRRQTMGIGGVAFAAAGCWGAMRTGRRPSRPPTCDGSPRLPIEPGASLRILRPAKFVEPDEVIFRENTKRSSPPPTASRRAIDFSGWEDLRPQTAVTANTGAGPDVVVGWTDDPASI